MIFGVAANRLKLVYDDVDINENSVLCTTCYMLIMKPRSHKSLDDVLLSLEHVDVHEIGSENNVNKCKINVTSRSIIVTHAFGRPCFVNMFYK